MILYEVGTCLQHYHPFNIIPKKDPREILTRTFVLLFSRLLSPKGKEINRLHPLFSTMGTCSDE